MLLGENRGFSKILGGLTSTLVDNDF